MSSQPSSFSESWNSEPRPILFLPFEEIGLDRHRSILTMSDLGRIHGYYFIPSQFDIELSSPVDQVHCPPIGWLEIYEDSLKAGLRFPFHPFVIKLMTQYNMCPAQIAPNSWRIIIGFLSLCLLHKRNPIVDLFRACYSLKGHPDKDWWYFSLRKNLQFLRGIPSSVHRWKVQFFFCKI